MIIEIDAKLATAFDVKVSHPTSAVRQRDFQVVMTWLEFNYPTRSRGVAFRLPIDTQRKSAGVGRDFDRAELYLLFLGIGSRRSARETEGECDQNRDRGFDNG